MSIVSNQTIADSDTQVSGLRSIRHEFTDHLGKVHIRGARKVNGAWTEVEYSAERLGIISVLENDLAWEEVQQQINVAIMNGNPDKVPDHQTQIDFDRRFLGASMLLDTDSLLSCQPVYDRVQTEGANNNQRATYLGITSQEYGLVNDRYVDAISNQWYRDLEVIHRWTEINGAFL